MYDLLSSSHTLTFRKPGGIFGRQIMRLPTIALAATLVSCAPTPISPPKANGAEAPPQLAVPPWFLGYTGCVETVDLDTGERRVQPVSWLNESIYDDRAESDATIAHERVHKAQMRRFSRCRDFYSWYRANTIESEAEAFCASARTYKEAHPAEITIDGAVWRYARQLQNPYYSLGTSHAAAIAAIKDFCNRKDS